ncbi:uncharacterized protein METZ01_LOCUS405227, partial [marine metagenome]
MGFLFITFPPLSSLKFIKGLHVSSETLKEIGLIMVKNQGLTSGFYLIFNLALFLVITIPLQGQDTTSIVTEDDTESFVVEDGPTIVYPGKPLMMSLVLPGRGQLYNKEPLWKSGLFAGIELGSMVSIFYANKKADELRRDYQDLADENWNLYNWSTFTSTSGPNVTTVNGMAFTDFEAMNNYTGTHHLMLHLTGGAANQFNTDLISSDSLGLLVEYLGSGDVSLVRDRHFYENIGKYDQFVGGWSDASTDWYWEEKDVGDSIEIVIKT